ncbi:hypothetical protein [Microbacterium sp. YY-01]|uniref:hypothetical protein n=1 Tax=Microbacterium sp. YY-01 TaxID=3421634 RepID=UPI003D17ADC8
MRSGIWGTRKITHRENARKRGRAIPAAVAGAVAVVLSFGAIAPALADTPDPVASHSPAGDQESSDPTQTPDPIDVTAAPDDEIPAPVDESPAPDEGADDSAPTLSPEDDGAPPAEEISESDSENDSDLPIPDAPTPVVTPFAVGPDGIQPPYVRWTVKHDPSGISLAAPLFRSMAQRHLTS